jgi:replicative DNA helicase
LPTLFFQIELSPEPMCERFISRSTGIDTLEVESRTRQGEVFDVSPWDHVYHCNDSRIDLEKMEDIIDRAELKMGKRPVLVLVDYVGLMAGGGGGKRYERMSTIAEGLKTLARSSETVIIIASQVKRDPEREEVDLHDAKDSGSVENSAQLVMGAWRPSVDRMSIKILKQTKRAGQVTIDCSFNGDKQLIQELSYDAG